MERQAAIFGFAMRLSMFKGRCRLSSSKDLISWIRCALYVVQTLIFVITLTYRIINKIHSKKRFGKVIMLSSASTYCNNSLPREPLFAEPGSSSIIVEEVEIYFSFSEAIFDN